VKADVRSPNPQPPPHVVGEILRIALDRSFRSDGAAVVQFARVCAWCGQIDYRGERPCREGEVPGIVDAREPWDQSDHKCERCSEIAHRHPEVFRWVTEVLAFREFVISLPVPAISSVPSPGRC
jgi:hypothetical protein